MVSESEFLAFVMSYEPAADKLLTIPQATAFINESYGTDFNEKQVQNWADSFVMPFFKGPDNVRRIFRAEIKVYFRERQNAAIKLCREEAEKRKKKRPRHN